MKLSQFLFRYRGLALIVIFVGGFWAPLDRLRGAHPASTWLWLSGAVAGLGIVSMATSTLLVMGVAILFALMAAMLRTWAVAYMGSPVVQDSVLHAERIPAGGPYRYIRNQLYVGLWLYAMAVVILMPPGGALFVMLAVTLLIVALVHAAESSLAAHHGEAYAQYLRAVPGFFPAISPRVTSGHARPRWVQAFLEEIHLWGVVVTYIVFANRYNVTILIQGVLISLGISIILRALLTPSAPAVG